MGDYAAGQKGSTLRGLPLAEIKDMRVTEQHILDMMQIPPAYSLTEIIEALYRGAKRISETANNGSATLLFLDVEKSALKITTPTYIYREPLNTSKPR